MVQGTAAAPTREMFGKRGNNGWAIAFVTNLDPEGHPQIFPREHQKEGSRAVVYNAAKARGIKVETLTYNGELWACRV